jgi:hypothetical protein
MHSTVALVAGKPGGLMVVSPSDGQVAEDGLPMLSLHLPPQKEQLKPPMSC